MRWLLSLLALFPLPGIALAQDAVSVELIAKAQVGSGQPELVVRTHRMVFDIALEATRSLDGKEIALKTGPLDKGKEHRFPLELPRPGKSRFDGSLTVDLGKGSSAKMPIGVEVELLDELEVKVRPEDVDLANRSFDFSSSRPVARLQIEVISETGVGLGRSEARFDPPQGAGSKGRASWQQQSAGTVMRIQVRAYDSYGLFGEVELFPWQFTVPHEEVHFATGSYEITRAEAPKLEQSFRLITDAITKFQGLGKIRLFIAGHTDSVGTPESNLTLSRNRARAIGRWFKKRGVKIPILYAGFGESKLLVNTPDETDEIRNRRAEYIVAIDAPAVGGVAWEPL